MKRMFDTTMITVAATWIASATLLAADEGGGNPMESGTPWNAIVTLITFGLLLGILGKFVWPVVLKGLQDRENFIRDSLTQAKTEREEAERLLTEYKSQLEQARQEATKIVEEGRRDSEVVRREILDEARAEADATMKRAKREIEIARDTAVKDLYQMSATLATDIAGRIVKKELDAQGHEDLLQESLRHLQSMPERN